MLLNAECGFISRGFNSAASTKLSTRQNWTRSSQMNKAFTGMNSRAFGTPVYGIMQSGAEWCPPERVGAIKSQGTISGQGLSFNALIMGKGDLSKTIASSGGLSYVNLAKGINIGATIDDALAIMNATLKGRAFIDTLIRIGADPSAEDIVYAMMDTPTGAVEETMTFRQTLKVLLAVAAGKTEINDLGGGNATVKFRNVGDTKDVITADMTGSERTEVDLDKT
jgi:hypothetical protein